MPISKTPLEYHRYYFASQRRVEQWVQDTRRQCQGPQSNPTQWQGFLEDPGLATPISMPSPLDKGKSRELEKQGADPVDHDKIPCHDSDSINRMPNEVDGDHQQRHRRRSSSVGKTSPGLGQSHTRTLGNDVMVAPSSSKHSKKSKRSEQTTKSKQSHSSSRKLQSRKEKANRSILVYVPYGIIPLLFAISTGTSPLSLAAASIILAGYFCLDYNAQERR